MIRRAALLVAALICASCASASQQENAAQYLVYTRAAGTASETIWIGDVDGRNMRALTRGYAPLVAPDGSKIAFHRCLEEYERCLDAEASPGVYTIARTGGKPRLVTRGFADAWFPDSKHLLSAGASLVKTHAETGKSTVLARTPGQNYGWSFSPSGDEIVYAAALKENEAWGICRSTVDLFVVDADGGASRRLTRTGRSSDPVWGDDGIAFARHLGKPRCYRPNPGIWRVQPDGSDMRAIVRVAPRRFAWNGYYGLRPYAWVPGRPLMLAGVRSEWGDELAVVDTRSAGTRKIDLDPRRRYSASMYVAHVSRDGLHVVGAACGAEYPCTIQLFSVAERRYREVITGRVNSPHWNR